MLKKELTEQLQTRIRDGYGTEPSEATKEQVYTALCSLVNGELATMRRATDERIKGCEMKQVYYLSMEFLIGKSLRNNLSNLGLEEKAEKAVRACGLSLEQLYETEPDAALGNGGLGRLAACYLDSLAKLGYPATGYSLLYEYGIFRQEIENGRQIELPDSWLGGGRVWLDERRDQAVEVRFGGEVLETWYGSFHHTEHVGYDSVIAVPYDFYVSGYNSDTVSRLRLWKAESPGIDMESFNRGDYAAAMLKNNTAELITKILYPNDNQIDGKLLRLRQQYFLCSASMADIVRAHLEQYGTLDNLAEKVAVHVNDTHPTLAIPELMRIMLDECGYGWEKAMEIVKQCFAYTNHTILSEALERWNSELIRREIPRIYELIEEIDRNLQRDAGKLGDDAVSRMRIIADGEVRTANLCAYVSHSVNGVSALHSDIVRDSLFPDFAHMDRDKFCNVTNGIAYRRWLMQGNPGLTALLEDRIGGAFKENAAELVGLRAFVEDDATLKALAEVKRENKRRFAEYAADTMDIKLDPETLFDVQAKRFHEYKRQHLSLLCTVRRYLDIINGMGEGFVPRTCLYGGKAAPGYYMAKEMIRLCCALGSFLEKDCRANGLVKVAFLPNFRVSMSELLMPAAELSEQISLAGKEASGTGNMKLMLGGAITIGTLDGANIEIREAAGEENFFLFGMSKEQVLSSMDSYKPMDIYRSNARLAEVLDFISSGALGDSFDALVNELKNNDRYMVLKDFDDYCRVQYSTDRVYTDSETWQKRSLMNISGFGCFSADRSVSEYSDNIWRIQKIK